VANLKFGCEHHPKKLAVPVTTRTATVSTGERLKMALAGVCEKRCVTRDQTIPVFAGGCGKDAIRRIAGRRSRKK
jgi:hypothetical protein